MTIETAEFKFFTIPYPPSANRYWRVPKALGRPILSSEARAYKQLAGYEALRQGVKKVPGPLSIELRVYRPRKIGDLDNTAKVALDSLNGIAWDDDGQIVHLEMFRYDDSKNPRIEVIVSEFQF